MTDRIDVVYRGPFQSRRIRLILDVLDRLARPVHFVWVDPQSSGGAPAFFDEFVASRPSLVDGSYLPGDRRSTIDLVRSLRRRDRPADLVVAIGFTALFPARLLGPGKLVWCINGIPEERLLYGQGRRSRAAVTGLWRAARIGRAPDVAITVSKPMSALVRSRLATPQSIELPTAVDRAVFRPRPPEDPPLLNYVGSGAPWQNLDLLGAVWQEVARRHDDAHFLVVSKDERARVAIEGLDPERSRIVAGATPGDVAELTAPAALGFVIRTPHLVNEVSYPTKFGEYVASETEVITTDIGWDLADVVRATGCGRLVDWRDGPASIAEEVVEHLTSRTPDERRRACQEAAEMLDRDRWIDRVGQQLDHAIG
jgi:glycosyltransferase involved in cell wall biosynthesis